MIEGQEGVTWPQWQEIAAGCEQHGVPTLFRSDHYMNLDGQHPERGALDALGTVIALAAQTTTLRLGTLVSPATFRHPSSHSWEASLQVQVTLHHTRLDHLLLLLKNTSKCEVPSPFLL